MRNIFAFIFIFFTITYSNAQYTWTNGKLILKNGDTLIGQIKIPMNSGRLLAMNRKDKVSFRTDRDDKKVKFDEDEVERFFVTVGTKEVSEYVYKNLSKRNKRIFRVVRRGRVNLYLRYVIMDLRNSNSSAPTYHYTDRVTEFFILKEGDSNLKPLITAKISKSFKKRAIDYFENCKALIEKLENKIYDKDDVIKVVEEYNNCE